MLYNIYSSNIHKNIDSDVEILAYADDVVIFCKDKHIEKICRKLAYNLGVVGRNLADLDLQLAPEKTQFCIFAKSNRFSTIENTIHNSNSKIIFDNQVIPVRSTVGFLGFVLDCNMSWKPQIHKMLSCCNKRLNILKAIAGIGWGAHHLTILTAYRGLIRSVLDFGGLVLTDLPDNKVICLDRIQYAAIRCVLGFMRTTPTNVMLDQTAEWPFNVRRQFYFAKTAVNCLVSNLTNFAHKFLMHLNFPHPFSDAPCGSISRISNQFSSQFLVEYKYELAQLEPSRFQGYINFPFKTKYTEIVVDLESFENLSKFRRKVGNYYYAGRKRLSVAGIN